MTINEILTKVNELNPNQYTDAIMISWLSELEWKLVHVIFEQHDYPDEEFQERVEEFAGYTEDSINDEVLVPDEFCSLYENYLRAMIAFNNNEGIRYQNAMQMFNTNFGDYAAYYNRKNLPHSNQLSLF